MDYTRRSSTGSGSTGESGSGAAPGKRTLVDRVQLKRAAAPAEAGAEDELGAPVQFLEGVGGATEDPWAVHAGAALGLATPASELPHADTIGRAFGHHDVSAIQAHTGAEAASSAAGMGAKAFATGDHVVLGDSTDLHTVAHEAAHVVQQRGGVQLKGAVGEAGDAYEQHADNVADRVVAGESVEGLLDQYAGDRGGSAGVRSAVQRSLKIGPQVGATDVTHAFKNQDPAQPQRTAQDYAQEVATAMAAELGADSPLLAEIQANAAAISAHLIEWIEDAPGTMEAKSNPIYGREKQDRHYATLTELGQGLLGWAKSDANRQQEKALAAQVYQNSVLDVYFTSLLHKAALKIHNLQHLDGNVDQARRDNIVNELTTGQSVVPGHQGEEIGHYRHVFDTHALGAPVQTTFHGDMYQVLQNGAGFDVKNKVVVFHDLMEYFGNPRPWVTPGTGAGLLPDPGADKGRSTTAIDAGGNRTAHTNDRGMAWPASFNNATRNENEAGTQLARQHDIPLWAGQSMTTVRVENLAEWFGASKEEKTALAWALFAFWHIDYDNTSQWAYHTLHETMDMASNFGVDYNMLNRDASLATFTPGNLRQDMRNRWAAVRANALQAAATFAGLDAASPIRATVDPKLQQVNQSLVAANQAFQAAGPLPQDQQVAASHQIMQQLNICELFCNSARTDLGL